MKKKKKVMSSDVLFVLFIYLFIHKTNLIFLKVLYKSKFFIKKLIWFFFTKTNFFDLY